MTGNVPPFPIGAKMRLRVKEAQRRFNLGTKRK